MKQKFLQKEKEFTAQLQASAPDLLQENPLSLTIAELKDHDHLQHAFTLPPKLKFLYTRIKTRYGIEGLALYQKLTLASLICNYLGSLYDKRFPGSINSLYNFWFARIYEDFSVQPDFYYDVDSKFFSPVSQDLAICSERTIPVGEAWVIERRMLPHKLVILNAQKWSQDYQSERSRCRKSLHKPLANTFKKFGCYKAVMRMLAASPKFFGGAWCYIIHTADRNICNFNQENMDIAYRNIANLLMLDCSIWGVFRESWFLDPELKEISPNLAFLWEIPVKNGANLYYGGPCSSWDLKRATMFSSVRSKLYKEGIYRPQNYFYFWPRDKIIESYN